MSDLAERPILALGTYLKALSHIKLLRYLVIIMTLTSTVFKRKTFQN